jgi:hypothetical protein
MVILQEGENLEDLQPFFILSVSFAILVGKGKNWRLCCFRALSWIIFVEHPCAYLTVGLI